MTPAAPGRHSVGSMRALLAAVAVALVLAAAASAAAPPPTPMLGTWTRTVTAADVQRAGATRVIAGLTWTLTIARRGSVARHGKLIMRGQIIPSNATQVNIELGQQKPNLYDWRRAGKKLFLHRRSDSNADRSAVLQGTWTKRSG